MTGTTARDGVGAGDGLSSSRGGGRGDGKEYGDTHGTGRGDGSLRRDDVTRKDSGWPQEPRRPQRGAKASQR